MTDASKTTFPKIPAKSWFALRKKWQAAVPRGEITASYLASLLDMDVQSAQANVLRALKSIGLVTEDGKLTDLAMHWRIDDEYAKVCHQIRDSIYPHELLDLYPNPQAPDERQKVKDWFLKATKSGTAAAQMFAAFYNLLAEADLSKADQQAGKDRKRPKGKSRNSNPTALNSASGSQKDNIEQSNYTDVSSGDPLILPKNIQTGVSMPKIDSPNSGLTLHIDLQIHISPDSTESQIETIFASIAKHIYEK